MDRSLTVTLYSTTMAGRKISLHLVFTPQLLISRPMFAWVGLLLMVTRANHLEPARFAKGSAEHGLVYKLQEPSHLQTTEKRRANNSSWERWRKEFGRQKNSRVAQW